MSAVRFEAEHNYNKDSREAMYAWMARWLQGSPAGVRLPERSFTAPALPDLLVFHRRPLPEGAVTAETLTSAWIDAARRQLAATPVAIRAAALRHALGFVDPPDADAAGSAVLPVAGGAPRAAGRPASRRPVALLAGSVGPVERPLRAAGFEVRAVRFTPFDAAAAAKVQYFDTYNRTAASQRAADIVRAVRETPGAVLVAAGDEALAAALAAVVEPPRLAILDVNGFDTTHDDAFLERLEIPGIRRAGDIQTALDAAGSRLVVHNAGSRLAATGPRVQQAALAPGDIAALARLAVR